METNNVAGVTLSSPQLNYPITLPYTKKQDLRTITIFDALESTLNSNEDFKIDQNLKVDVNHIQIPVGRGRKAVQQYRDKEIAYSKKKKVWYQLGEFI